MSETPDSPPAPSKAEPTAPEPHTQDGEASLDNLVGDQPPGARLSLADEAPPAGTSSSASLDDVDLDELISKKPPGARLKLTPEAPSPESSASLDDVDLDELISKKTPGARLKLTPAAPPSASSTPRGDMNLDELISTQPPGERLRLTKDEALPPAAGSTMDELFAAPRSKNDDDDDDEESPRSDLDAASQAGDQDDEKLPPSTMESLLQLWTSLFMANHASESGAGSTDALLAFSKRLDLIMGEDAGPPAGGGDLPTSDDRTSRMRLREDSSQATGPAILEALMRFAGRIPLRDVPDLGEAAGGDLPTSDDRTSRMRLREDSSQATGPAILEALMRFTGRISLRDQGGDNGEAGGDLTLSSDRTSRMRLREDTQLKLGQAVLEELMRFSQRFPLRQESAAGDAEGMELLLSRDGRIPLRERPSVSEESPLQGLLHFLREMPDRSNTAEPSSTMDSLFAQLDSGAGSALENAAPPSSMDLILDKLAQERMSGERRSAEQPPSSMAEIYNSAGRVRVWKKGLRRYQMPDDMSRILSGTSDPRLPLPARTSRRLVPPGPDGVTPMKPAVEAVFGELDPRQRCPKSGVTPRVIGEELHERLDFRYNRFRRLEIRRPVYDCPGCPDADQIIAGRPLFWCREAPLGNGLLAMLATTRYFYRLPLDKLTPMLDQLGAPIATAALLSELDRAGEALAPLVALMQEGARTAEAPLSALVTGSVRDTPGAVHVHTGGGHVVFTFVSGEARKTDAARAMGPTALQRWRGQGSRGRWAQIRQRFFLALLTDPVLARAGLHAIQKLPPDPPTDASGLSAFRAWLDVAYDTFEVPRSRYQHAVTAVMAMWPMLTKPDPKARAQVTDTWVFESSDGDVHQALCWLSLVESCALQGLQPWAYLFRLLEALISQPDLDLRDWTPAAVAQRG